MKLTLAAALLVTTLPMLQGCVPALIAGGAAATVLSVNDRRSTGVQTDDETTEWKAAAKIPAQYKDGTHANFTSYNRILLITGEVFSEDAKQAIGSAASQVEGVRQVHNELIVAPTTSLGARSNDSFIDSKVKARLVDSNQISANHIKVVTERGQTYLMGIVSERESKVAIAVARTTDGVRKVVNLLEVLPDDDIRRIDSHAIGTRKAPPPAASAPVEAR
ncbi:MAG: BON domain-containing protein [Azonexus sp.]